MLYAFLGGGQKPAHKERREDPVIRKEDGISCHPLDWFPAFAPRPRRPCHLEMIQEVHDEAARVMGKDGSPRFSDPAFQIFYHAPTVIFIFGEKDFAWTQVDCGIAVENMALAAEGLGIGSVILGLPKPAFMGGKAEELRQKLQCPDGYDFVIALALGYATDTKEAHELREEKISRIC